MDAGRPRGISETTWAMAAIDLLASYSAIDWHGPHFVSTFALRCLVFMGRCIVLFFYWEGYNWARILVLLASVAGLWNLTYWAHVGSLLRILIAVNATLGVFLLYWLNTRDLKKYFDPGPTTLLSGSDVRVAE
jgi:hypothetical protein